MIALLFLTAALAARPQAVVHPDERAAYETMLVKQAIDADALFSGTRCDAAVVSDVSIQTVAIKDHPDFAAVHERVRVTGCGRDTVQNLSVGRVGGKLTWRMTANLPGESLADPVLQRAALPQALADANVELPADCKVHHMGEVYVTARPGRPDFPPPRAAAPKPQPGRPQIRLPPELEAQREKLDIPSAWVEVWPLSLCGQDRTTLVAFIPRRDGAQSLYLLMPVWRLVLQRGPGALPPHAPAP
jgi:hypothetical protein